MSNFMRKPSDGKFIAIILFLMVVLNLVSSASAKTLIFKTKYYKVAIDLLVDNLSHPWGVSFLPDGTPLITERPGVLKLASPTRGVEIVKGLPKVWAEGQGGLLDIAVHPKFLKNKLIYLSYSEPSEDGRSAGTALALGRLNQLKNPKIQGLKVLFSQTRKTDSSRHFGSRIVITPENMLFLTIGDRGDGDRAQDHFDHAGSIIRLNLDGVYIPSFNKSIKHLAFSFKNNFSIVGSAHNLKEIKIKEIQKANKIFISSIFKKNQNYLGFNRFKLISNMTKKKVVALGGISKKNINKLKLIKNPEFAGISFFE